MYPAVSMRADLPNTHRLSSCSLERMRSVIQSKGTCLAKPHPCSDMDGACCIGHHLIAAGVVCAMPPLEETCLEPALCDGDSAACPSYINRPDGEPCAIDGDPSVAGMCSNGKCRHLHDHVCEAYGMVGCTYPGLDCAHTCAPTRKSPTNECLPLSSNCPMLEGSWNLIPAGEGCASAGNGELCAADADSLGICEAATMACIACSVPGCGGSGGMDGDDETFVCDYGVLAETPCSEPCGGGQQVGTQEREEKLLRAHVLIYVQSAHVTTSTRLSPYRRYRSPVAAKASKRESYWTQMRAFVSTSCLVCPRQSLEEASCS